MIRSGRGIYPKLKYSLSRRAFLGTVASGALGLAALGIRTKKQNVAAHIGGAILGANAELGHLLRTGVAPQVAEQREISVTIVGGGISGLSAAWKLDKLGFSNFCLLELEANVGGNSISGQNHISAYPWGAHYVPVPGKEANLVQELFYELGVITGHDSTGRPFYDESDICFPV